MFGTRTLASLAAVSALLALGACGSLEFEKEDFDNSAPITFFDVAPPDTTFANEVSFRWIGTDLDSDVVAYQYKLVETDSLWYYDGGPASAGSEIRIVAPLPEGRGADGWSERVTSNFEAFALLPDGWYEMRARSIDSEGASSDSAVSRFYVFFDDVPPEVEIVGPPGTTRSPCGRIGTSTAWTFWFNATDASRSSATPRSSLQYSYQLRARRTDNCSSHLSDGFTQFQFFPDDGDIPVEVGNALPTLYTDLFDGACGWVFTLRVRDPAGNTTTTACCISQTTGCQGF